ncbi:DUF3551 domain-containing protein [Afipia sp. GAS231]|uniref:DUF3551 domain-containing protein n=1 Tax=Afipia sp. GAS231 TaxID=1882747 RepID=UPI00352AA37F
MRLAANDPPSASGFADGGSGLGPDCHRPIPICIQGADDPGWSGCSFDTLRACQAAASGTEAECLSRHERFHNRPLSGTTALRRYC